MSKVKSTKKTFRIIMNAVFIIFFTTSIVISILGVKAYKDNNTTNCTKIKAVCVDSTYEWGYFDDSRVFSPIVEYTNPVTRKIERREISSSSSFAPNIGTKYTLYVRTDGTVMENASMSIVLLYGCLAIVFLGAALIEKKIEKSILEDWEDETK